ncbi:MAG: hypothetical protein IJ446_00070 [Oscillospiraceae bacterium]|nr:hypothetical protein [Oscillospiraceae bacterium]
MSYISKSKRISAAFIAAAMAASMTACGEDTIYCGTSQGEDIPSGLYIYYLMDAYFEATQTLTEQQNSGETTETDVFAITIDNVNARSWIASEAQDSLREHLAIEQKFNEYGLTLSEEEIQAAEINCESMWDYYGEFYEGYGISQESFLRTYLNGLKSDMLFEYVYGENGERTVPDETIRDYMKENYALVNYISMNLVDGEGNLLKSEGKTERMNMAKDYVERAKNGEDFDALVQEYQEFYNNMVAEAQAAAAEADTAEEVTETAVVTDSAAEDEAPAETSGAVTAAEEAVTTVSEETTASEETTTASEDTSAVTSEETTAETTVSETEAVTTSEETSAETNAWVGEEEAAAEGELILDTDDAAVTASNKQVIKKDSGIPDETVNAKIFEMETGDITIVEEDEYYYVVYKMDIFETDDYYESTKSSLLFEMREDDYNTLLSEWAAAVDFTINEKAVERYQPDKFAEEEEQ